MGCYRDGRPLIVRSGDGVPWSRAPSDSPCFRLHSTAWGGGAGERMKAGEVVFQGLLDGKIQYRVPLFQRTYSWKERNWEQLWDDLCLLYTSDAADDLLCVDLGGRRIIK